MNALTTRLRPVQAIMYAAAALLFAASVWFVLFTEHVTISAPATSSTSAFYHWFAASLPQERILDAFSVAGAIGLMVGAGAVRDRLGAAAPGARYGAFAVATGGLVWAVDTTFVIGGHHAVGQMATHGNPIDAANEIAFTVDTIDHAFTVLTFLLLACGFAGLAARVRALGAKERGWSTFTWLVAAGSLLVALGFILASDDLGQWSLAITGAVLLPGWLAWSARRLAASPTGPVAVPAAEAVAF